MAKPVSSDLAARWQAGDEPLQQEDPQFPMPWIKCPRVALVLGMKIPMLGFIYSFAYVLLIILEKEPSYGVGDWGSRHTHPE